MASFIQVGNHKISADEITVVTVSKNPKAWIGGLILIALAVTGIAFSISLREMGYKGYDTLIGLLMPGFFIAAALLYSEKGFLVKVKTKSGDTIRSHSTGKKHAYKLSNEYISSMPS